MHLRQIAHLLFLASAHAMDSDSARIILHDIELMFDLHLHTDGDNKV